MAYHRLHSSNSDNNCVFAAAFVTVEFTLKTVLSDTFVCFLTENETISNFLPAIFFPFHIGQTYVPCYGYFCFSGVPLSILAFRFTDFAHFICLAQIRYCYQSCTYTVHLLLTVLLCWYNYQKIKFVQL